MLVFVMFKMFNDSVSAACWDSYLHALERLNSSNILPNVVSYRLLTHLKCPGGLMFGGVSFKLKHCHKKVENLWLGDASGGNLCL